MELIATWTKPVISLQTSFAFNQGNKIKVILSLDETNKLSYLYSSQFLEFFSDNFLAKEKIKTVPMIFTIAPGFSASIIVLSIEKRIDLVFPGLIQAVLACVFEIVLKVNFMVT